jgi:hypothetical protein
MIDSILFFDIKISIPLKMIFTNKHFDKKIWRKIKNIRPPIQPSVLDIMEHSGANVIKNFLLVTDSRDK